MRKRPAQNAAKKLFARHAPAGARRRRRLAVETLESRTMLAAIPRPDHVVIVIEENRDYSQIIGSANAPYINALAQQGALMTASTGVEHPSQPNYLDLFSGSNQGVHDNSRPAGLPFATANLGAELLAANFSFTGYSESLPAAGFDGDSFTSIPGQNQYQRKHNPWANFIHEPAGVNQMPAWVNQPFTSFPADFAQLPTVAIVVPNEQNDMHDGSIQQGDAWLQSHLDGYVQWANDHNSLLVVTWDENDDSPGNHIPTLFVGPMVRSGQYGEPINHFNVLRTLEDMYGLPYAGASGSAAPITSIWEPSAAAQQYVTAVYQDVLGRSPDAGGLVYWALLIDQGAAIGSVADSIAHSDEYYANFVIRPNYLQLLGRPADAAGVSYWTSQMRQGLTDQRLQAGFAASDEFYQSAGGTDADWVDAVYQRLLGRPADASGQAYWTDQLAQGRTRSQAAERIAGGVERNAQVIHADYLHYLGREADSAGLAFWLERFAAGETNEDLIAGITGSAEYYQRRVA